MNAVIIHESRGRMRLQCRLKQKEMSLRQADLLEAWFQQQSWTSRVTVHERTGCVILYYTGARETVLRAVRRFSWEQAEQSVSLPAHSSRMLNRQFEEKLVGKAALKLVSTLFLPAPVRIARVPVSYTHLDVYKRQVWGMLAVFSASVMVLPFSTSA